MFEFNKLSRLVHLGLHEQAKFYASEQYDDLSVLRTRSNGAFLCIYCRADYRGEYGPGIIFIRLK